MIKKLVLIFMISLSLIVSPKSEVSAVVGYDDFTGFDDYADISWTANVYSATEWSVDGTITFESNSDSIVINIDDDFEDYFVFETATMTSRIFFSDSTGTIVDSIDWENAYGEEMTGIFDIDLDSYGVRDMDVTEIHLRIMLVSPSAPQQSLLDALEGEVEAKVYTYNPEYRDLYFRYANDYQVISYANDFPVGEVSLIFDFTDVEKWDVGANINNIYTKSSIYMTKADYSVTYFYLEDYVDFYSNQVVELDLLVDYLDYDLSDPFTTFVVSLYSRYKVDTEFINDMNRQLTFYYEDVNLLRINFLSLGVLIGSDTIRLGDVPNTPTPTPPTGFEFYGWYYDTGIKFNPYSVPIEYVNSNDYMQVNAYYRATGTGIDYDVDDPISELDTNTSDNIVNVLTAFGFNNEIGGVILYATVIILSIIIVAMGLPLVIMGVIDLLLTALFVYLSMIPLLVSTISFLVIIVIMLLFGGNKNE